MGIKSLPPIPAINHNHEHCGFNAAYAEYLVAADFLRRGFEVYKPMNQQCRHDLLIDEGAAIKRVEVKLADESSTGTPLTNLRSKVGRFDLLALVSKAGIITYRSHRDVFGFDPEPIA